MVLLQTWYVVDYNLPEEDTVMAAEPDAQLSSVGMKCAGYQSGITYSFCLAVTPVSVHCSAPRPQQLAYRVTADTNIWALSGKTTGEFGALSGKTTGEFGAFSDKTTGEFGALSGKTTGEFGAPSGKTTGEFLSLIHI